MTGEPTPPAPTSAERRASVAVSRRGLGRGGSSKRGWTLSTRTGRARSVTVSTAARGGRAASETRRSSAAAAESASGAAGAQLPSCTVRSASLQVHSKASAERRRILAARQSLKPRPLAAEPLGEPARRQVGQFAESVDAPAAETRRHLGAQAEQGQRRGTEPAGVPARRHDGDIAARAGREAGAG